MNLANHMQRAGNAHGDRPAFARGARVVQTYRATAEHVARIASTLRERFKLGPGDRVGLVMANCPQYVELMYACWHAGLVVVPINAKLHASEFEFILTQSSCRLCFVSTALAETIASLSVTALERIIDVDGGEYRLLLNAEPMSVCARQAQDPAWIFFTSGTTGKPKGATLSHRNLLAMISCYFADVDQGAPWGAWIHAAPISHGSGCYGLAHVAQGSCLVFPESGRFEPAEIFSIIAHWPNVSTFAAPTMVKRLVDHPHDEDTTNLKAVVYGGGPMYLQDCQAAISRFGPKLGQLYGQGESPMTITALSVRAHADFDHPRYLQRLASAGIAQSLVDVGVVDEDDRLLPNGKLGEVVVRGDAVMLGYWSNPQATAKTLRNGWLHTGDIGQFDQDGFLTLKDRSKDMIISGGTNIYPREIEEVLLRHSGVAEISVIGTPDREWGEIVVAYVVSVSPNATSSQTLDEFCLANLARFKRPKHYRFISSLPKNNYGKVLKTELRRIEEKRRECESG